jgi:hypothetical protein
MYVCMIAASLWRAVAANAQQVIESTRAYEPIHRELFDHTLGWRDEWFHPDFLRVIRTDAKNQPSALASFITEDAPRVYSFPLFTPTFCRALLGELKNYEQTKLLKSRPNSMNKFGLILNDMVTHPLMEQSSFAVKLLPSSAHVTSTIGYGVNDGYIGTNLPSATISNLISPSRWSYSRSSSFFYCSIST